MANAPPPPAWADRRQVTVTDASPPGGFWLRVVALLFDSFILTFAALIVIGIFAAVILLASDEPIDEMKGTLAVMLAPLLIVIIFFVTGWLYEALMTSSPRGATLGKQAVGLRIVRADGARLSFGRATARHFLKTLVTPMTFLVGYLMVAFTARKRALHDVLADTLVIKSR